MSARRRLVAILGVVGVLVLGGAAFAYFTSTGSGTGAGATGTLNPPTNVSAGPATGITVPVSWTASATGGGAVAPQGYYVTESNGSTTSPACGTDSTHLITSGTSCTDGNGTSYSSTSGGPTNPPLANGSYTYTVVAVYYSWSASGTSGSVSVNVAAPTVTTVIGQASGAVVNGYVQSNAGYYVYANVTDNSGTGIQSVTANLANVTSGDAAVTLTAGSYTAPGGGSYGYRSGSIIISNPSQADGPVQYTVNATDNSARTSTYSNNGSVTFDTTGPTGGAPTVTGGYYTSTSVPVSLGSMTDNSGGSGVNNSTIVLQRDQAVFSNNSCGTFPGTFSTTVTLVGSDDTSVSSGFCYQYREQATDNVGNVGTSSASNVAMVDAIAPAVPLPTVNGH